ncbi:MAG: hypothetical protein ACKVQU_08575 [Burkholderiales bacterium]
MATPKEQMNVQVTAAAKQLAKTCATAHQKSLNVWIEIAIREQAARDRKTFNLDAMNKALKKVARQYLPGKVATEAQMLAMAQRVAAEDSEEGFTVERHRESSPAPRRRTQSARTRSR